MNKQAAIEAALPLVERTANRIYKEVQNQGSSSKADTGTTTGGGGIEWEELYAEGSLALCEAAERWDPDQGDLEPYAAKFVEGGMRRYCEANRSIKFSQSQSRLMYKVRAAEDELSQILQRTPTQQDIADHLNVDVSKVRDAVADATMFIPLDRDATENRLSTQPVDIENIAAPEDYSNDGQERSQLIDWIMAAVDSLPPLQRTVVNCTYGLNGESPRTADAIATRLGITERDVAKIEREALADLRHPSHQL